MNTFNVPIDYNTLSHELRIPLTGILGMTELLIQEDGLSATQKEEITLIRQSGDRLHTFIERILDCQSNVKTLLWKKCKARVKKQPPITM